MTKFPWMYRTMRRPRRLTWYSVITQVFTLIGRLVARSATAQGALKTPVRTHKTTRRRKM